MSIIRSFFHCLIIYELNLINSFQIQFTILTQFLFLTSNFKYTHGRIFQLVNHEVDPSYPNLPWMKEILLYGFLLLLHLIWTLNKHAIHHFQYFKVDGQNQFYLHLKLCSNHLFLVYQLCLLRVLLFNHTNCWIKISLLLLLLLFQYRYYLFSALKYYKSFQGQLVLLFILMLILHPTCLLFFVKHLQQKFYSLLKQVIH